MFTWLIVVLCKFLYSFFSLSVAVQELELELEQAC